MACSSCSSRRTPTVRWKHVAPDGTETIRRQKYEVEYLLKKYGGVIESVRV